MSKVSIILPCYNEEESLPLFFEAVDPVIKAIDGFEFDFVLVDDGSKDATIDVMTALYLSRNDITIVKESRNFGQNAAFSAGLMTAKGDYVVMMDADLQDPVELLVDICEKFKEGYDVVNPHRTNRKSDSFLKRTTAKMFYSFCNILEGKKVIPENVNCYRGLSRRAVDYLNSLPEKDRFYVSIVPLVGFKTIELDFTRKPRKAGKSKYNIGKMFNYAFNLISTSTARPLYFPIIFGSVTGCLNLLLSIIFAILWGVLKYPYHYFFFLFFGLLLVSVIIFFIGILGLYLHNILINTRERPTYNIEQIRTPEDKVQEKTTKEIEE